MLIQGLRFLAPAEARQALEEGALLVDLRDEDLVAMKRFAVDDVRFLPHRQLPARLQELPRDRTLLLADTSGVFIRPAAALLAAQGFTDLLCLNGGMLAWDLAGLPVATDPEALLQGECACVMKNRKASR
jgi:rhodanese-related sulfurtransferase